MSDDTVTLSRIAAMPDDTNWVALLRERIAKLYLAHGEVALPPVARTVFLVDRVVTNTLSGGLENLVPPWACIDEARAIRDALVNVGAARMAEVFRRACELAETTTPDEWEDEQSAASIALDGLENEFGEIGFEEIDVAVQVYVQQHRADFLTS